MITHPTNTRIAIPNHSDPLARITLIGLLLAVVAIAFVVPQPTRAEPIIVLPTRSLVTGQSGNSAIETAPTAALPTALPTEAPSLSQAPPTMAPPTMEPPAQPAEPAAEVTAPMNQEVEANAAPVQPEPTAEQPAAPPPQPLPEGSVVGQNGVIIIPTSAPVNPDDFAPPPTDPCANPMIGSLACPRAP